MESEKPISSNNCFNRIRLHRFYRFVYKKANITVSCGRAGKHNFGFGLILYFNIAAI
jgi:hypothetical protein